MTVPTPPSRINVVAAVLEVDGRYLLAQRPHNKRHGGLWEFPGGKVAAGESFVEALGRELEEELGLFLVNAGELLLSLDDGSSAFTIHFIRAAATGQPECREHLDVRWLSLSELLTHDLAPSDRAFVERVLEI